MKKHKNRPQESNDNNNFSKSDHSPIIPQRNKFKGSLNIYKRELTQHQQDFINLALDKQSKLIFVSGPAGTGKTFLSVQVALEMINSKRVSDLLYIRSVVESAEAKLGYLPGEVTEKMSPYLVPLIDKLEELLPRDQIEILKKEERISGVPVGHLRGRNFNAKVILADECQNLNFKELLTLCTRCGEFTKLFAIGDPDQSDINGKSGFVKMMSTFDDEESRNNGIHVFRFTDDDIVRSALVRFIAKKVKNITQPICI
jgi:phosphate starvation-inducible PhoH-like protein